MVPRMKSRVASIGPVSGSGERATSLPKASAALHRPAHDEAGQGHLDLGVGAETLADLRSYQLATGVTCTASM